MDLYIANTFEGITGERIVYGESYTWMSRTAGIQNEQVSIPSPQGGTYYLEACSYTGTATSYDLATSWR